MSTASNSANVVNTQRNVKQLLLPYVVAQVVLLAVIQIITALRGPEIDLIDGLLLVPSWLLMVGYMTIYRVPLSQIRFGFVVLHAATFAVVNGAYHLAAFVRIVSEKYDGNQIPLDASWFGPLIAMCGFWAIGLVGHIASSVSRRGYDG